MPGVYLTVQAVVITQSKHNEFSFAEPGQTRLAASQVGIHFFLLHMVDHGSHSDITVTLETLPECQMKFISLRSRGDSGNHWYLIAEQQQQQMSRSFI